MNGFCSGRCNRFLLCTLILCSPTAEAASSAGELTGLLSFGALLTCLERLFFIILDKLITWDYFWNYFCWGVEIDCMWWVGLEYGLVL